MDGGNPESSEKRGTSVYGVYSIQEVNYGKKVEKSNETVEYGEASGKAKDVCPHEKVTQENIQRKSYAQAVMEEGTSKWNMNQNRTEEDNGSRKSCLGKIDIGSLNEDLMLEDMGRAGLKDVIIRRFSCRDFLITFDEQKAFNCDRENGWKSLSNWFDNIRQWSEVSMVDHRITWLVCYGVPIHAWCLETFQNVGRVFGEFIKMDETTLKSESFSKFENRS
ncbi:hypothetical protein REPUB_Repub16aG0083200 [Reevesia pubescens]